MTRPADRVAAVVEDLYRDGPAGGPVEQRRALRAVDPCVVWPATATRRSRIAAPDGLSAEMPPMDPVAGRARFDGCEDAATFVEQMAATVQGEVMQLVPVFTPGSFEFSRLVADAVLRRGAKLRAVWSSKVLEEPAAAAHAKWLAARRSAPRVVDHVPIRATLVDRAAAIVHDEEGRVGLIQLNRVLGSLSLIGDRLWRNGIESDFTSREPADRSCDARKQMVLRLLAEGLTDDAIARRIGVSVRTVRNDVAGAMVGLRARSRFQAGVRAVQLGLV